MPLCLDYSTTRVGRELGRVRALGSGKGAGVSSRPPFYLIFLGIWACAQGRVKYNVSKSLPISVVIRPLPKFQGGSHMYISLFVDVEDGCTPLSDDIARDMADIISGHGLSGNLMVVGDKARVLERRGRQDVIAALCRHEIGLHSDRHSRHPTIAEYLEDKGWHDGIEEAIRREGPGVAALQRVFAQPPSCWGQPGGSWGPQIHPAVKRLGIPIVVYPETCTRRSDIHWYGGTLTFGYRHVFEGFDPLYSDDEQFQRHFGAFRAKVDECLHLGLPWMGLFLGHPIYVRAHEFGDVLNLGHGVETPPELWRQPPLKSDAEYRTALKNLAVLCQPGYPDRRSQALASRSRRRAGAGQPCVR